MVLLSRIVNAIVSNRRRIDNFLDRILQPESRDEQVTEQLGELFTETTASDEVIGAVVDAVEESIVSPVQQQGQLDPDNVEGLTDEVEGAAAQYLLALFTAGEALEAASVGQIDQQTDAILEIASALQVDNVTGLELEARTQEGILPALEQKANREHRSKKINLQDFVEHDLRNKDQDEGFLTDPDIYGIRPDQVDKLEEVSIEALEPEELIESIVQFNVVPDLETVQEELDRKGISEELKQLFLQAASNAPEIEDVIDQHIAKGELLRLMDGAVRDGQLTVDQAMTFVNRNVDNQDTRDAIRSRLELIDSFDLDFPNITDATGWFEQGLINESRYRQLLDRFGFPSEFQDLKVEEALVETDPEEIRRLQALGRIGESAARRRLELIGFSDQQTAQILSGQDPDEVLQEQLQQDGEVGNVGLEAVPGIGPARSTALNAAGIQNLQQLADANVDQVTQFVDVSDTDAQRFIQIARNLVQQS